jgi:UDP-2,3-diacylglucosamine pyrophosphatase LpxH
MLLPQFDEIHVVSDLHMGGLQGAQILRDTQRLALFIRFLADRRPDDKVALILNGDVIDTLAEESGGYIAVENAVAVVGRIMGDPSFSPVWDALAYFAAKKDRRLVIVLGNHDIELAFPAVQLAIVDRLAGTDIENRGRIEFSCMGTGYSCLVGGSRVFCTHGNEVDAWNYIRYEDLSKAARRLNAGRTLKPEEWEPNAGTKLVKDVMNGVKRQYPWIDLLKPEMKGAIGVLLALDPSQLGKIKRLLPVVGEKIKGGLEVDQRLSADGFSPSSEKSPHRESLDSLLGPSMQEGFSLGSAKGSSTVDSMLLDAEEKFRGGSALTDPKDETLGAGQYIWERLTSWLTGVSPAESLRRALVDWLKDDKTFMIDDRDDTFNEMIKTVGSDVHFIITGHTHLERAIDLGNKRFYFNCGTWIRLLGFTKKILENETRFTPVFKLLQRCSMKDIDAASFDGPFVQDKSSAVCIKTEDNKVIGQLLHIQDNGGVVSSQVIQQFQR